MNKQLSTYQIKQAVADHFHCQVSDLDEHTTKREIVIKRQIAHFLAQKNDTDSLNMIGAKIGGRDHATVLHSVKVINNLMDTKYRLNCTRIDRIIEEIEMFMYNKTNLEHKMNYSGNSDCWFLFC